MYKWIIAMCLVMVVGCETTKEKVKPSLVNPNTQPSTDVQTGLKELGTGADKLVNTLDKSANTVSDNATGIKQNVTDARTKTLPDNKPSLDPIYNDIDKKAELIMHESVDLHALSTNVAKASGTLDQLAKTMGTVQGRMEELLNQIKERDTIIEQMKQDAQAKAEANAETIAKLKSDNAQLLQKSLIYLTLLGVLLIAAGITASVLGNPKLMSLAIGGVSLLGISLGVMYISKFAWVIGGVLALGIIALIAAGIWYAIDLVQHQKALADVVKVAEVAKGELTQDAKDVVSSGPQSAASIINSPTTQSLVDEVRSGFTSTETKVSDELKNISGKIETLIGQPKDPPSPA